MSAEENQTFLSDRPIDSEGADQFGHIEYVDSLEEMVKSVDPPWHVGIFGEWGAGKTSIIRLLFSRIREKSEFNNIVAVEFDAWSHAEGSIRTELLLKLDQKIGEFVNPGKGEILGEDEITGRLYDVQEEEYVQKRGSRRVRLNEFVSRYPFLIGAFVVIAAVSLGFYTVGDTSTASIVATWLLLPILGYIIQRLDDVTKTIQRTYLHPRKEWSGAYQRIFESIVEGSDAEKIIISVDNLDRCESETVYDVLVSLKTFMENDRCIYLIPCDDRALVKHIQTIEDENQREFLRKFFQAHIRIPPKLVEDIESYAANQNSTLSDRLEPETLDVITNAYIDNPRRIKHAINRVCTLRLIAHEVEGAETVGGGRITDEEPFLAKVAILEEEFPTFFEEISADPDLLLDITDYYNNELESEHRESRVRNVLDIGDSEGESRLQAFLRSTRRISVSDPQRFLYLAEPSYATGVEDVDEFLDNLKTGHGEAVKEELRSIYERDEQVGPYVEAIRRNLEKFHQNGREQPFFGIMDTTIAVFDILEDAEKQLVAQTLSNYLTTDLGRELLPEFETEAVFRVVVYMEGNPQRLVLNAYTELVCDGDTLNKSVLETFAQFAEDIPQSVVTQLSSNLDALDDSEWEAVFDVFEPDPAKSHLVTSKVLRKAVSMIEIDEDANEISYTEYYKRFDAEATSRDRSRFVQRLLDLREEYDGGQPVQIDQVMAAELLDVDKEIESSVAERLFREIRELVSKSGQEPVQLVEVCFHYLESFPQDVEEQFHAWLGELFQQWNPQHVQELFSYSDNYNISILEWEEEVTHLLNRIPGNINDEQFIVVQIVPDIPPEFEQQLGEKVLELLRHNDFNNVKIGLSILTGYPEKFEGIKDEVIDTCGTQAQQANNLDQKRSFLEIGAKWFGEIDGPAQENYISHLEHLLTGNANHHELYQELWEILEAEADPDRREAIAGDVREETAQQLSQGQNPEQLNPLFAILHSLTEHIGKQNGARLMERLSDRLTDSLNPGQQAIVIAQIGGFDDFFDKGSQIVDRVENVLGKTDHAEVRAHAVELFHALHDAGEITQDRLQELVAEYGE